MELDLDKARAARLEAKGEGHSFTFQGVVFSLPPEMPFEAAEAMQRGEFRVVLAEMLNGTSEKFFELRPTTNDLEALVDGFVAIYAPGSTVGESSASSSSSKRTSKSSRRPSKPTTAST